MQEFLAKFKAEGERALVDRGQGRESALCCYVAGGDLLIEETPGVGKTTLVKTVARVLGLDCKRVQFTNDLLPADILGGQVFDAGSRRLSFHRGPILAQLVRGDELSRASPRMMTCTRVAEIDEACLYARPGVVSTPRSAWPDLVGRLSVSGARARSPPAG
jgi:MoxR-like ATPase